nr:zinc finger and BTB domain-containing protein 7A-like isoform X6 [Cherax quadricarinatus]
MTDGMLSLSWNNHSTTFCHTLASLRSKERYTDVTLACDGKFYPVHKLVLSTCSEYFENMFEHTPCKHPVIVLRDVQYDELEALLSYMYAGVVSVAQTDLARLIKVAELLQIKGLAVPDEPPNSSKTAFNQQNTDDRTSPHIRSRHSHEKSSPYTKIKQSHSSSDDRSSPHPKRRRRLESDTPREDIHSTSSSPSKGTSQSLEDERLQEEQSIWAEGRDVRQRSETEPEDRVDYLPPTQDSLTAKVQVTLDESLVKEEVVEDLRDSHNDASEPDQNFDGMTGDSSGGGQDQWPGGGDMARRLALGEGFIGEGSQDLTSLSLGQSGTQAHQLVRMENDDEMTDCDGSQGASNDLANCSSTNRCPFCSYITNRSHRLKMHIRTHTGERPFACSHCSYQASTKDRMKIHLRTHTGEKPYICPHCSYCGVKKSNLDRHLKTHMDKVPYN